MAKFFAALMWVPLLLWVGIDAVRYRNVDALKSHTPEWGVTFSVKQAEALGIPPQETYRAILDDLGAKRLRLIAYWDRLQPTADSFDFSELEWQIRDAERFGAEVILALGMKLPRWPECHVPLWAEELKEAKLESGPQRFEKALFDYVKAVVERFKDSPSVAMWQVENEPFFRFGECPHISRMRVEKEIALVHELDSRPVLVTDSGELGTWFGAARLGDVVGTTMYRRNWKKGLGYFNYPLPAQLYAKKARVIKRLFGDETFVVEMQAEPWVPTPPITNYSAEAQFVGLDFGRFKEHFEYARRSGISPVYLWGVEWWWWLARNGHPEFWEYAKEKFGLR